MEFKKGQRVYHKHLERRCIFLEYDWTGKSECYVLFDADEDEVFDDVKHVTTSQLEPVNE